MATIICDIDGCTYSLDTAGRGYMRMGAHRFREHGLRASDNPPKARKVGEEGEEIPVSASFPPSSPTPGEEKAPAQMAEVVPKRPKGWRDRFKLRGKPEAAAAPSRERIPKRTGLRKGPRVPLDTDISDAWAFLGRRFETTPHYPTGRMLQYQAPAAGYIIDKAIAGTLPDRVLLQPLVRTRDKWEDVGFLLAGPMITFSITRTLQEMQVAIQDGDQERAAALQQRYEMQLEGFNWLLEAMLPKLVEGKKVAAKKKAEKEAVIAEAFPELIGTGINPAEALRDMLFAPPSFMGDQKNGRAASTAGNFGGPDFVAERRSAPGGA